MEEKLLVVDDDPDVRGFLERFLTEEGYEVVLAANGEQALELVAVENPTVILLDVNMPGIDGIEVCRILKSEEITRDIPVVIITALDDRGFMAYLEGADDFVCKPFSTVELTFRIRSMLRVRQLHTELMIAQDYIQQLEKKIFELKENSSTE